MEYFIQFVIENWYIEIPLIISIAALILFEKSKRASKIEPQAATIMINKQKARVLDVRSAIEFSKGTIPNAVNVNKDNASCISALKGDLDNPVIFVCNQGTDSSKIASNLKKDLKEVYVINGGINAWKSEGFPIVN
jgi:rhodanese-related sulfurtransferase|nr:MAG: sulfurtransferase [Gammaproteobacteria bacterium]